MAWAPASRWRRGWPTRRTCSASCPPCAPSSPFFGSAAMRRSGRLQAARILAHFYTQSKGLMTSAVRPLRAGLVRAAAALWWGAGVPAAAQDTAAAAAAQAQAPLSPFMRHMEDARARSRDASWAAATDSARAAREAARLNRNRLRNLSTPRCCCSTCCSGKARIAEARAVAEARIEDLQGPGRRRRDGHPVVAGDRSRHGGGRGARGRPAAG